MGLQRVLYQNILGLHTQRGEPWGIMVHPRAQSAHGDADLMS